MFVFALVALYGCEQKMLVGGGTTGGEDDIFMPTDGYIFFNVQQPETRGALIEGALPYNFNVIGYNYPNAWNTVRVQAKQSKEVTYTSNGSIQRAKMGVFYSTAQTSGIQLVAYTGGYHSYQYADGTKNTEGKYVYGLKPWIAELKHAFFAWYPVTRPNENANGDPIVIQVNGGNNNYEGEPYITYNLPTGEGIVARQAMVDVMTACEIDQTKYNVENNGGSINFQMKHRLAALDIVATSIIKAKDLKDTWKKKAEANADKAIKDANGNVIITLDQINAIADDATVTVKNISGLSLSLNSIKTSAKIYLNTMDATDPLTQTIVSGTHTPTYTGFESSGVTVGYYNSVDNAMRLMGENEKLILIPQTESITANLAFTYVVSCTSNGVTYEVTNTPTIAPTVIKGLLEGHYHYLLLTFTASGVYVKAQVEETWEPHNVYYDFE